MRLHGLAILFLICLLTSACSTPAPVWRLRAQMQINELNRLEAAKLFPQEHNNIKETFEHGESILRIHEDQETADSFFLLVLQKAAVLKAEISSLKARQLEEKRRRDAELALRAREERIMKEAAEAEERLRLQEQRQAEEEAKAARKASSHRESAPVKSPSYTVKRGETLPQIAARSEIYNDASLWPIIYRANRDQIRDPKRLWPGQVLTIPRSFSRGEAIDAKRYSGMK